LRKPACSDCSHHCATISKEQAMFKHILLATDGSKASDEAVRLAVDLAAEQGARLTAVYVIDPYPYAGVGEASAQGFQAYMSAAYEYAGQADARVSELCQRAGRTVDKQFMRLEGVSAVESIVQAVKDQGADLVVVGSHGRTGVARLMLGSTAAKLVAQSPVPVLVARGKPAA